MSALTIGQSQDSTAGKVRLSVRLYIAGEAPASLRAVVNIEDICTELAGMKYDLEIVDVLKNPLRALDDGVLITPTLVRLSPEPPLKIIGDLSERRKVADLIRPRRYR